MKIWEFKSKADKGFQRAIRQEITTSIRERKQKGVYHSYPEIHEVLQKELEGIRESYVFLKYVATVLQYSWAIDIADFEIPSGKGLSGKMKLKLQKLIWKMLRFSTYHLWVQQREFNAMLRSCLLLQLKTWVQREKSLQNRLARLQGKLK